LVLDGSKSFFNPSKNIKTPKRLSEFSLKSSYERNSTPKTKCKSDEGWLAYWQLTAAPWHSRKTPCTAMKAVTSLKLVFGPILRWMLNYFDRPVNTFSRPRWWSVRSHSNTKSSCFTDPLPAQSV